MEIYKLTRPVDYDGEKVTEIAMDLDGMTVKDIERCEREAKLMLQKRENMAVPETNKKYLACVAAKAAGVKTDLIFNLSAKDYTQITLLVQNFLLDGDSDLEEEETPDTRRLSHPVSQTD